MKLQKKITEGEMLPWGYGIAWRHWSSNQAICYPIGLNIIMAILYGLLNIIRGGLFPIKSCPRAAYRQGFEDGIRANIDKSQ